MFRSRVVWPLGGSFVFLLLACGDSGPFANIAVVTTESSVAGHDLLASMARSFYRDYPDDYDMLVFWGAPGLGPGFSYFLPVQNDVVGIGYQHTGPELFDESAEFGSSRLQGIIWMAPTFLTNPVKEGPDSVLGILAQETAHRWEATVWFADGDSKSGVSEDLLGDGPHWSFFLDTGASPLGGNEWEENGDSLFTAFPVNGVEYNQFDLYLMGLIAAEEVEPLRLLFNIRDENGVPNSHFTADSQRVTEAATVWADSREITLQQILDVEGERGPDTGFNAHSIRQAWIYVSKKTPSESITELQKLETLRSDWSEFFYQATGGLSLMNTSLY